MIDKLVNPKVRDKQNTVEVIRKYFGQFVLRSRVDNHPALDAEGPQQAKVMDWKNGLAAEVLRGVFGYNTDSHMDSRGTKYVRVP